MVADLLVQPGGLDEEAVDLLSEDVVDPWVSGPQDVREGVRELLRRLDPHVPDFLDAAWNQVVTGGPAASQMAANAVVEAIDRTLRAAAPDAEVLAAAERGELGKNATYLRGGKAAPTRRGRVAYILRSRPGDVKMASSLVESMVTSTAKLVEELQAGKHSSPLPLVLVQTHLVSAEALLTHLVLDPSED